jgi:hypothetical protein
MDFCWTEGTECTITVLLNRRYRMYHYGTVKQKVQKVPLRYCWTEGTITVLFIYPASCTVTLASPSACFRTFQEQFSSINFLCTCGDPHYTSNTYPLGPLNFPTFEPKHPSSQVHFSVSQAPFLPGKMYWHKLWSTHKYLPAKVPVHLSLCSVPLSISCHYHPHFMFPHSELSPQQPVSTHST